MSAPAAALDHRGLERIAAACQQADDGACGGAIARSAPRLRLVRVVRQAVDRLAADDRERREAHRDDGGFIRISGTLHVVTEQTVAPVVNPAGT
jgi:hypothetical protein